MNNRALAIAFVNDVVPSDYGDMKFARVIGDLYTEGPNAGTTCGFLASYLLHALGCRAPEIVNRNDPEAGLKYQIGGNISRLVSGAKALGAWREGPGGIKPGDIYFISNGPPATEHVGVFLGAPDAVHWETADAGQRDAAGHQAARKTIRDFDGTHLGSPNGPKIVQGYVDLEALPYAAMPDLEVSAEAPLVSVGRAVATVAAVLASAALVTIGVSGMLHERRPALPAREEA